MWCQLFLYHIKAPEDSADRYYDVGGIYQTFETEEEAQEYADTLNSAEHITELFAAKDVAEDRLGVFVIDGLTLRQLLVEQG